MSVEMSGISVTDAGKGGIAVTNGRQLDYAKCIEASEPPPRSARKPTADAARIEGHTVQAVVYRYITRVL